MTEKDCKDHPEDIDWEDMTLAHHEDGKSCWYVAIGSMMNPVSMRLRGLHPLESYPCKVKGFELHFKLGGMASAEKCPPGSDGHMHGVLHRMTLEDMAVLDELERTYLKHVTPAHVYHPTEFVKNAYIYHMDIKDWKGMEIKPPTERYIDIMCLGCRHHGVDEKWHEWLQAVEARPRKTAAEFDRIPDPAPDAKEYTFQEIYDGDGEDGRPLLMAINNKVLAYAGPTDIGQYKFYKARAGRDVSVGYARALYEPKYPIVEKYEDLVPDHLGFLEDLMINFQEKTFHDWWKVVGRVDSCALTKDQLEKYGHIFSSNAGKKKEADKGDDGKKAE